MMDAPRPVLTLQGIIAINKKILLHNHKTNITLRTNGDPLLSTNPQAQFKF